MDDSIKGMAFINDNKGKYEIVINKENNGIFSARLIKNDSNGTSVIIPLNMSDIYAQCAPARIIERLKRDIQESGDMIKTIEADSHEAAPEHDTPNNIPF